MESILKRRECALNEGEITALSQVQHEKKVMRK